MAQPVNSPEATENVLFHNGSKSLASRSGAARPWIYPAALIRTWRHAFAGLCRIDSVPDTLDGLVQINAGRQHAILRQSNEQCRIGAGGLATSARESPARAFDEQSRVVLPECTSGGLHGYPATHIATGFYKRISAQ